MFVCSTNIERHGTRVNRRRHDGGRPATGPAPLWSGRTVRSVGHERPLTGQRTPLTSTTLGMSGTAAVAIQPNVVADPGCSVPFHTTLRPVASNGVPCVIVPLQV